MADDFTDEPPSNYSADQTGLNLWQRYAAPAQERMLDRPQEQRNAYGRVALGLVPGPGNVISAQDAQESWESAREKFNAGRPAAGDAAMAGLGALGAVPFLGTLAKAGANGVREVAGMGRAAYRGLAGDARAVVDSPVFQALRTPASIPAKSDAFARAAPEAAAEMARRGMPMTGRRAGFAADVDFLKRSGVIARTDAGLVLTDTGRALHGLPPRNTPAAAAMAMREAGGTNADIHAATGLAFTPAGELVREIPDTAAKLSLESRAAGSSARLGDILHHPELYSHRPELSSMPVRLVEKPWVETPSRAVTDMGNTLGVSVSDLSAPALDYIRGQILKRVQQSEPGLSIAGRHVVGSNTSDLERTSANIDDLLRKYVHDSDLKKYAGLINEYKTKLAEMVSAGKTPGRMENYLYERMTGGDLADLVRARSLSPDAPAMPFAPHKYTTEAPNIVRMFRPDRLPLPPKGVEGDALAEWARNWSKYGGRP